jgi:hypothetical protein
MSVGDGDTVAGGAVSITAGLSTAAANLAGGAVTLTAGHGTLYLHAIFSYTSK